MIILSISKALNKNKYFFFFGGGGGGGGGEGERPILQQASYFTGLISGRKGSYLGPHFAKSPFLSYFGYTKVLIVTTL